MIGYIVASSTAFIKSWNVRFLTEFTSIYAINWCNKLYKLVLIEFKATESWVHVVSKAAERENAGFGMET
jgi:hypothetical protein